MRRAQLGVFALTVLAGPFGRIYAQSAQNALIDLGPGTAHTGSHDGASGGGSLDPWMLGILVALRAMLAASGNGANSRMTPVRARIDRQPCSHS
jgi:hypothetical protein